MAEIEIRLGSVMGGGGELQFSVELDGEGRTWVVLYASPFGAGRGVLMKLGVASLDNLESKIAEARVALAGLERLVGR